MQGMENVNVFFLLQERNIHDVKVPLILDNAPCWGGLQLYQQRLIAWCLVEASPRFSVRNPISSIKPCYFSYAIFHNARTRLSHYNILACVTSSV